MKFFSAKIVSVLLLSFSLLHSQKLNHPLSAGENLPKRPAAASAVSSADTVKILAVMMQFQKDATSLTSGDGTFDRTVSQEKIIDAPPRDLAFFSDHLTFARNYYRKASKGKTEIVFTILPDTLTLDGKMEAYAPVSSNKPLALMVEESWKKSIARYPQFPFDAYTMFVIFHAGSGKDIDMRGSLGYDPTPYDLPSLYMDSSAIRSHLGKQIVLTNNFVLPNTAILPETENRKLPAMGGDFLFQLGTNGLIVATIGSYLGLPDLFDTKTGRTAIGRFGLMDGQSIFSFSGLFPPEPSAWEKIRLGWTSPLTVAEGTAKYTFPSSGFYPGAADTIYKIPIAAKEYFLVENRNRDPRGNGQTITMRWNGSLYTKTFLIDTAHFNFASVDSVYGNVTDVEDLDWSLPGAVDYDGGLLIWHIDEAIIEQKLPANAINADPLRRGIDLEEADGSQDIGQSYGMLDAGSGSEDGSPIDYWFEGNDSPVFKNEFTEKSYPNSLSNSGASSHISIKKISRKGGVMTAEASLGDASIALAPLRKLRSPKLTMQDSPLSADLNDDRKQELIFTSGDSLFVLKENGSPFFPNASGYFAAKGGSRFQPIVVRGFFSAPSWSSFSISTVIAACSDSVLYLYRTADLNTDGSADTLFTVRLPGSISAPLMFRNHSGQKYIWAGTANGWTCKIFSDSTVQMEKTRSSGVGLTGASSASDGLLAATATRLWNADGPVSGDWNFSGKKIKAFCAGTAGSADPSVIAAVAFDDGSMSILHLNSKTELRAGVDGISGIPVMADVDRDGKTDILIGAGTKLYAFNANGIVLDNFPVTAADGGTLAGGAVVISNSVQNKNIILFGSSNGHLSAATGKGESLPGFPLQTGGILSSPVFHNTAIGIVSTDSSLYRWNTAGLFDTSLILWKNFLGDEGHSNFYTNVNRMTVRSNELMPSSNAYNWPNPVYGSSTNIRYYLSKPAAVSIRIFNQAGELVDEVAGTGNGGIDNEVIWNVQKIQSGVYFARIKASGGGEEKDAVIKIAVVK